jgi:hypothetical protein
LRRPPHSTEGVSDRLGGHHRSSNLDERQLPLLIGAGYMIVSERALNPGGLWSETAFPPTLPT